MTTTYIQQFLQKHYDDQHLAAFLKAAEAGYVDPFLKTNCLIGYCNTGQNSIDGYAYTFASDNNLARQAEGEFFSMWNELHKCSIKEAFNHLIIPLIIAEIDRRMVLVANQTKEQEVAYA